MRQKGVTESVSIGVVACVALGVVAWNRVSGAPSHPAYIPRGITESRAFYFPNQTADPVTGMKATWSTPWSTRTPRYHFWQNQEHSVVRADDNRVLLILMENNRAYTAPPNIEYVDAFKFLEYDDRILTDATTPNSESAYWRGNPGTPRHYVWSPYVLKDEGTYYLYFTAQDPIDPWWHACYLATSTTGSTNAAEWVDYDADPATPAIDPVFRGVDESVKDFHVIRVETDQGPRYYCYYIANPTAPDPLDPTQNVTICEVRLRISDNPLHWAGLPETVVFRRTNAGLIDPSRYPGDYENPEIVQYDDGTFYLLISRHGGLPYGWETDPDARPIPLSTEVYWSPDGMYFSILNQLPNLTSPSGGNINAGEYFRIGSRWFVTEAQPSYNPDYYEFDSPWENPTTHSAWVLFMLSSYTVPDNCQRIMELEWAVFTGARNWELYR